MLGLFPPEPGLGAVIASGQAGSCSVFYVFVLSSSGQFLRGQLCPLCRSDGLPQTVSTVCWERVRQMCLLRQ